MEKIIILIFFMYRDLKYLTFSSDNYDVISSLSNLETL